jgi:hypothetical protein
MKQIVMLLSAFLILLFTSGCAQKLILVPTACEIPRLEENVIDNSKKTTGLDMAKQCTTNYFKTKEDLDKLKKAIEVCQ